MGALFADLNEKYCEDLGETLCPPDWAGIADVTQRVAAESSFALAKGNVKGNGILGTPVKLMVPASRWGCSRYTMRHARRNNNATALIYRCPMARHPCSTSQHFVTSDKRTTARATTHVASHPQLPTNYRTLFIAPQYPKPKLLPATPSRERNELLSVVSLRARNFMKFHGRVIVYCTCMGPR